MLPERNPAAAANPYAPPGDDGRDRPSDPPRRPLPLDAKPWRTIWTRPRETVRRLVETDPTYGVLLLTSLGGIGQSLDRASLKNAGDTYPLPTILGMACLLGPLGGLLGLWVSSFVLRVAGSWLGGVATSRQVRTAIAWATVPSLFASTMWLPQLALLGSEMFTSDTPRMDASPGLGVALIATALVEVVAGVWTFVLACNTIAEVQGFRSAWAGLGNGLLAILLVFVPLVAIAILLVVVLPLLFR